MSRELADHLQYYAEIGVTGISRADAGFDVDTNAVMLVTAEGAEPVPLAPKTHIASVILDRAEKLSSWTRVS